MAERKWYSVCIGWDGSISIRQYSGLSRSAELEAAAMSNQRVHMVTADLDYASREMSKLAYQAARTNPEGGDVVVIKQKQYSVMAYASGVDDEERVWVGDSFVEMVNKTTEFSLRYPDCVVRATEETYYQPHDCHVGNHQLQYTNDAGLVKCVKCGVEVKPE